jgi:hypothetical protein
LHHDIAVLVQQLGRACWSWQRQDDTLKEILTAVRDVLYLLDFYAGAAWALSCVSAGVVRAL